jgi:hypothetical protein
VRVVKNTIYSSLKKKKMQYKVVPFEANASRNDNSSTVAAQVQSAINQHLADGWEYQRLETVETFVKPSNGCFGFGAQPGYTLGIQMLIFKKETA